MIDETIFWNTPPQAFWTAVEMGARYELGHIDGISSAIERIHVIRGTTAVRIDALRQHRPFTPAFIGRAEDQAYAMSPRNQCSRRLACLHADSLIMRHDKETFASEAIDSATSRHWLSVSFGFEDPTGYRIVEGSMVGEGTSTFTNPADGSPEGFEPGAIAAVSIEFSYHN